MRKQNTKIALPNNDKIVAQLRDIHADIIGMRRIMHELGRLEGRPDSIMYLPAEIALDEAMAYMYLAVLRFQKTFRGGNEEEIENGPADT